MFENSVLLLKANKANVEDIYKEPTSDQIKAFKETLIALEEYLDVGDYADIDFKTIGVIKKDLLDIMKGFRSIQQTSPNEWVTLVESIDKIMASLREVRKIIFEVEGLFESGILRIDKRGIFFTKMDNCRENVAFALKSIY